MDQLTLTLVLHRFISSNLFIFLSICLLFVFYISLVSASLLLVLLLVDGQFSILEFFTPSRRFSPLLFHITSLSLLTSTQYPGFRGRTLRSGHHRCRTPLQIVSVTLISIYIKDDAFLIILDIMSCKCEDSLLMLIYFSIKYTSLQT